MGEVTEKIYCCDRGDNDNTLAAAIHGLPHRSRSLLKV